MLRDIESAPKDGTHIIIKGDCLDSSIISYYEAWYWKPGTIEQWEAGARPHWETLINGATYKIKNIVGWIPLPEEKNINNFKD